MILLAALLAAGTVSSAPALQPSDFSFVRVGVTTPAAAIEQRGTPDVDYPEWEVEGQIDWFIGLPGEESLDRLADAARASGHPVREVRVLEWDDPLDPSRTARLVFSRGTLWYALLPVSASEITPQQVADRFGRAAQIRPITMDGDLQATAKVYLYEREGVAYVAVGEPRFLWKALVPND